MTSCARSVGGGLLPSNSTCNETDQHFSLLRLDKHVGDFVHVTKGLSAKTFVTHLTMSVSIVMMNTLG